MTTTPGRLAGRAGWLLPLLLAALLLPARPATAHAFLAGTDPAQGERLPQPPETLSLQFSEAVSLPDVQLRLRRAGGGTVDLPDPRLASGGQVVQVALPELGEDVYVVEWQGISAIDGHGSAGEFAFAVGDAQGTIPTPGDQEQGSTGTPAATAATWLVFAGLALAAGGLTGRQTAAARPRARLLGRAARTLGLASYLGPAATPGAARSPRSRGPVPASSPATTLVTAAQGAAQAQATPSATTPGLARVWVQVSSLAALSGVTLRIALDGGPTQPGGPVLAGVALLLALAVPAARLHSAWPAALLLGAAVAGWASRSHGAAAGLLGWLTDLAHLAAAVVWAGALAWLVAAAWRGRRQGDQAGLLHAARSYARIATWLVALLVGTGGIAALRLLGRLEALWTTTYGWVLLAKLALLGVALALALTARSRGLARGRPGVLRRLTSGEAGTVTLALVLAAVLTHAPPPGLATTTASLLGPPPLQGPIARAAGLAGTLMLEVRAGDQRLDVLAQSPEGPVPDTDIQLTARYPGQRADAELHPRPCGDGCFTQHLTLPSGSTLLQVNAAAPDWPGATVELELHWPPPAEEPDRFTRLLAAMRAQPQVRVAETVTSDTTTPTPEPDPADGVLMRGEEFIAGMPYAGGGVTDVRPLPDDPAGFGFYLPGSRLQVTAWTDHAGRLTRARMVNPGHDIQQVFTYPQEPVPARSRP